jgi:hypothetical protein
VASHRSGTNVAVYLLGAANPQFAMRHLTLSYVGVVNEWKLHTLLTHSMMHGSPMHLLGNMASVSRGLLVARGRLVGSISTLVAVRCRGLMFASCSWYFLAAQLLQHWARRGFWQCTSEPAWPADSGSSQRQGGRCGPHRPWPNRSPGGLESAHPGP